MRIHEKLRDFRMENRIMAQEIARESGISSSMISRLERGWVPISKEYLDRIKTGYSKLEINADAFINDLESRVNNR